MNKRQQMRVSNSYAIPWLLDNGYDNIYLKPHRDPRKKKNKDWIITKEERYQITDFYNLFDGFCYDKDGNFVWFQISTQNWHQQQPYEEFLKGKNNCKILLICVKKPSPKFRKYRVLVRELFSTPLFKMHFPDQQLLPPIGE